MIDKRSGADRILIAEIWGEARRRAQWRQLTEDEGTSEGELDEPLARQAARLCRQAGADESAIPAWIEEGRRRAAAARTPPFSGGLR
jgi:hypothetical protein